MQAEVWGCKGAVQDEWQPGWAEELRARWGTLGSAAGWYQIVEG